MNCRNVLLSFITLSLLTTAAANAAILNIAAGVSASNSPFATVRASTVYDTTSLSVIPTAPGINENRAIIEFNLASLPRNIVINSASLTFNVNSYGGDYTANRITFAGYAGDGSITTSDFGAGSVFYSFSSYVTSGGTVDATSFLQSLLATNPDATYAGINIRDEAPAPELRILGINTFYMAGSPAYWRTPVLSINYTTVIPEPSMAALAAPLGLLLLRRR